MSGGATIEYQPALDGVRALAVAAVLLFHAGVPGFSGGYLGVSVFFTLSGFLITSLLDAEVRSNGRVAAGPFYARRARRLLPASVLVIGIVVVLAATTELFAGVSDLRAHVVGSLLQVANWVFLFGDGSYQDLLEQAAGAASPLEHYWSLAIEEQFYWIWPLAFAGLARVGRTPRGRVRVLAVVTVLAAVAAPVIAAVWGADAAYWATPARAAEILVGALLAVILAGRSLHAAWRWAAPVALAGLAVAVVTFPAAGGPAYRGALPLVAVVSGALLLGLQVDGPVRRVVALAPFVWLGRVSYGVYLFHWPIYVLLDERRTGLDGPALVVLRIALTLVVATVSFHLVEQPVRRASRMGVRATLVGAGAATAAVVVVAFAVVPAPGDEYWSVSDDLVEAAAIEPTEGTLPALLAPSSSVPPTSPPPSVPPGSDTTTAPTTAAAPTTTTEPPLPVPPRPVRIVVAGDSTAEATGVGLVGWAVANPDLAQVEVIASPGCGFLRDGDRFVQEWEPVPDRCREWLDVELPDRVAELRPDVVVLQTTSWDVLDRRWDGAAFVPTDPEYEIRLRADVADVSTRLVDAGAARVVWLRQPIPNVYWWSSGQPQEDPVRHGVLDTAIDLTVGAQPTSVSVVDLRAWLVADGLDDDRDARPDGVHWSPEAATDIAERFLGPALVRTALTAPEASS